MKSFPLFLRVILTPAAVALGQPRGEAVRLDPVVVTSSRTAQPLVVTTDPRAAAQPVPAHDGADILKHVPGFAVIRKGGTDGDPVLRGLAGSRLGVLIDGQHILGGCGNRMDPPTAYVFPAAYDRITIVKGPQSVRHGPGNSAGTVLFERTYRRLAADESAWHASLTAGSFGRLDAVADARVGTPAVQVRATATTTRADDYEDGNGQDVHGAYDRWSANAALVWTPDERTFLELSAARSDGEAAYADRAMDGVAFARENFALRARREFITPRVVAAELSVFHNYVDHVMDNYSLRRFSGSATMPNPAVSNPDRLTRGGLAQFDLLPWPSTRVTLGLDAQDNTHTVRSSMNQPGSPYTLKPQLRDARFMQRGAFVEIAGSLTEGRRVFAGARIDRWKATDTRPTVAVGMTAAANPSAFCVRRSTLASGFARYEHDFAAGAAPLTFFAGLGHVQRFPDYWEAIKNESSSSVSAFGTRPETTTQLDAGLLWRTPRLELSLSAFAAQIRDFVLVQSAFSKPAGMTGTRTATVTRNIDAHTSGGEATLAWRFHSAWKLEASLAGVRGRNGTDALPLAQLPPLEARLALAYTRPAWSAGGLVRAVARQDRVALNQGNIVGHDLGPTAGFAVVSLHGSWKPGEHTRLSAGLDNVFNRTYAEHLSRAGAAIAGFGQTTRVNEPGRMLWLKFDFAH
ncbi:MAG: TonB-dependent copper receptor [Opitutus sp.]|nr:TonB-dependent copper receptor [Opitutus sp.]